MSLTHSVAQGNSLVYILQETLRTSDGRREMALTGNQNLMSSSY